ncbi:MAG: heat-inducible transcription repressor HrcA [Christensenellaceae bacterium]|nr:heat-inducible transcription repressor HrcA [Christensenellaceae bacterium]
MTQLLDVRKMRILEAIVDDYILTASPVGSRTLSKRSDIELSPATIRNEMSDLTDLGFLEQPHTSAGRVPSEKAYRLYVNSIMDRAKLTDDEADYIRRHLNIRVNEVGEVIRETARMLSGITNYTSVVLTPQMKNARLKHISLIPVTEGSALAVIVTNSGGTSSTMLDVPTGVSPQQLEKISSLMNERLVGYRLTDIQATLLPMLREEVGEQAETIEAMLQGLSEGISKQEVEVVGAANMLNYPEYSDVSKAKSFLAEVEKGDYLKQVLEDEAGVEMTVRIGTENDNPELKDCSVVTVSYKVGNEQVGSMGVIGPTRMDYGKVVAVLKCMSESLSKVLSDMFKK